MWLHLLFSLALLMVMTPFWLGVLPPLNARCVIRIQNGRCFGVKAAPPHHVMSAVAEILDRAGVKKGFIAIMPAARVKFSHHIPKAIHQRLRNVVLNP